jgi:hypothetical protein
MYWNENPVHARFNFANTGRKTARRGTATLYAFTDTSSLKLGAAPILGSGPNVMPSFGGNADIHLSVIQINLRKFLLCAVYFDETSSEYEQSFLLLQDGEVSSTISSQLKEIAPFNSNLCANQPS